MTAQSRTADAIRAFEAGEIVVVTGDDGRENEGDLIRLRYPTAWPTKPSDAPMIRLRGGSCPMRR